MASEPLGDLVDQAYPSATYKPWVQHHLDESNATREWDAMVTYYGTSGGDTWDLKLWNWLKNKIAGLGGSAIMEDTTATMEDATITMEAS